MSIQNPNQFGLTPILGSLDQRSNNNTYFATIKSNSVFADFQVGTVVKLVSGVSPSILVDSAGATDAPEGVIIYNTKKNTYVAGATVQVAAIGSVIYLQASEAIARGQQVDFLNTGGTPTVGVKSGSNTGLGVALDQAAAAGALIRVRIQPSAAAA